MPRYTREQIEASEKVRERVYEIKHEILERIHPNREYMCHILEYFPDWNTSRGKGIIRSTWNGQLSNAEVLKMLEYVPNKLKNK